MTNEGSLIWLIDRWFHQFLVVPHRSQDLFKLLFTKGLVDEIHLNKSWLDDCNNIFPLILTSVLQFVIKQLICHQASKVLKKWTSLLPEAPPGAGAPSWQSHRQDRRSMWAGFQQQGGLGSTTEGGHPPVVGLKLGFTKPCKVRTICADHSFKIQ